MVRGALALVATCAIFGAVSPAVALGDVSPEATLADRYSPVVRLVAQTEECGAGEPYTPIDVDAVLGNDQVALRGLRVGDRVFDLVFRRIGDRIVAWGEGPDAGAVPLHLRNG